MKLKQFLFRYGVILVTLSLMCGCKSSIFMPDTQSKEIQDVLELVQGYFEEPQNRSFTVTPDILNGELVYTITVSGLLHNGEYPIDVLSVNVKTGEQFFLSSKNSEFVPLYTVPRFSCATSPSGEFRIESLGMYLDGPSGLHELEEMRVIDLESGDVLWSEDSFLDNRFLWSPNSQYVAIQYSGRTWTESKIIKSYVWSAISVPTQEEILPLCQEFSPPSENAGGVKLEPQKWLHDNILLFDVSWITDVGTEVKGTIEFNVNEMELLDTTLHEVSVG